MVVWDEENAAHLLSRAGFGGSVRDVARYVRMGQQRAVERLVTIQTWWAKRMVKAGSRRLQEKMCLFWSLQNRTFRLSGLGPLKTVVYQVTKDPAMLEFLDGRRNRAGKPNENYARELMELFTLGVIDLNGVENYTQTEVTQLARALTGFVVDVDVLDAPRLNEEEHHVHSRRLRRCRSARAYTARMARVHAE